MLTIEQAKEKYTKPFVPRDVTKYKQLIENNLPIEKIAVDKIQKEILHDSVGLPQIDLSFLSMEDEDGWPRFAVFHICNPVCKLEVSRSRPFGFSGRRICHHYWQTFDHYYDKFLDRLYKKSRHSRHYCSIETTFNGLIPVKVRNNIRDNLNKFRTENIYGSGAADYIFIVAESTGWSYKSKYVPPPIQKRDPLVIGLKNNIAYLIDSFDLEPIEDMVRREFTTDIKSST